MVAYNVTIAIIIVVLFVIIALVGYGIFFINQRVRLARSRIIEIDE